jgi:hypothetical protein
MKNPPIEVFRASLKENGVPEITGLLADEVTSDISAVR